MDETEEALRILGEGLHDLGVPAAQLLLDAPVSNSGRLRARVLEHAASWSMPVEVTLHADVDRELVGVERVVSSDSLVLDACASWVNLGAWLVGRALPQAWVVELSE